MTKINGGAGKSSGRILRGTQARYLAKEYFMKSNKRHEFSVQIEGIELPDDVVQRIDGAVRRAVLAELASVNLEGQAFDLVADDFAARRLHIPEGLGAHTQGVRVKVRPAL
ncbi:hypothetical protein [Streptomyces sp. A1547]|uniref:hypothetical protein n=1 Tax=Streptomyces sp. A1547 TaxID=2563105 RepID=UPI00109E458E|nr:hypothetical protein [Streptomyces sp. A1547]THA29627.1 hypothetical protein E6W17_39135 [Streptomyces sp. A1547]